MPIPSFYKMVGSCRLHRVTAYNVLNQLQNGRAPSHTHPHVHDTLTLPFCSWFKKFTLQSQVPSYMGLLEGIVVAACAIGLQTGSLLVKCLCRPCGFLGEDDLSFQSLQKISANRKILVTTTTSAQSI